MQDGLDGRGPESTPQACHAVLGPDCISPGMRHFLQSGAYRALCALVVVSMAPALAATCCAQDAQSMVEKAVQVQLHADETDHSCWLFHEVDRKPKDSVVQWVAQTHSGDVIRVMMKNGRPVSKADQHHKVQSFIEDESAQKQQREDAKKDDGQARSMLKLLPVAFNWKISSQNRNSTTLAFSPKSSFDPPTREARVFASMQGFLVVAKDGDRILEFKGHLIRDVDFGGGILGKLDKGGTFRIVRTPIGSGVWDITQTHIHIQGHALIFKSISEEEDDTRSSFTREPDSVTLQQAAAAVLKR